MSQLSELPQDRAVLIRYHEIALKGDNRGWFEERLMHNIHKALSETFGAPIKVLRERNRVLVPLQAPLSWNTQFIQGLRRVFGIANFSPIRLVPTDKEQITRAAIEEFRHYLQTHPMPATFRISTRRTEKALSETSLEIDRHIGSAVLAEHPGLKVSLDNPEFTLGVELHHEKSFVWAEKVEGLRGLPVGTNGHLLTLLSGGIDSPVAAIQVLKRGTTTSFLHFYGAPFVGPEVLEKIEDLLQVVNRYQPDREPLHVVHFGKIQEKVALATHPKLRTVLYRRLMFEIASRFARKINAHAIVTGESIGQVASQTVENMCAIDAAARIPVLRPLVSLDKDEIIALAQRWGTYEISIRPSADCCTLFADRHPALRADIERIQEAELRFPKEELILEALENIETRRAR